LQEIGLMRQLMAYRSGFDGAGGPCRHGRTGDAPDAQKRPESTNRGIR
jgi:hypothetical protein